MRVAYERHPDLALYKAAIWRRFTMRDVDFVDGMIHSPAKYVLSVGTFADEAPYTNRYDWLKVYYRSTAERSEDYLRTADYFFRYDNGVTNVHPKTAAGRLLFGRFMHSSQILRAAEKLHRLLPAERPTITIDLFLPFSKLEAFLEWYEAEMGFYPIWCVPYRRIRDYEWLSPEFWAGIDDELFIDLAIYGMKQRSGRNDYLAIEDKLRELHGIKTLISYNYYEPKVFWSIWNKPNYLAVKAATDPQNAFRDLYSKTCRAPRGLDDLPM